MTDTDSSVTPSGDFKSMGMRWLFGQGVSTVLLGLILAGLWFGIPKLIDKQSADLKQCRDDFKAELATQRSDFKEVIKDCCDDRKK